MRKCSDKSAIPEVFKIDGHEITGRAVITNVFNEYYVNVGKKLASRNSSTHLGFRHFLKDQTAETIFLTPATEAEIVKIFKKIKPKKRYGADNLNYYTIKELGPSVVNKITLAINKSIENGEVPRCLKVAKVIAIFKKEETDQFVNYRPISILPAMSKILEKVLHKRL